MEIEGRVILDLPMESGTSKAGNPWRKKQWVMEQFSNTGFPRKVMFQAFGQKIDNVHVELGKCYAVSIDVESREYNGRWYTDVNAYAAREIEGPTMTAPGAGGGYNYGGAAPAAPAAAPFGAAPAAPAFGAAPAAAPVFGAAPAGDNFGASPAAPAAAPADGGTDDLPF